MRAALATAPEAFSSEARSSRSELVVRLPYPGGGFRSFEVWNDPVMVPSLARKYPEIQSYSGQSLTGAPTDVRISMTPLGFSASIRGAKGLWYVEPADHLDPDVYVSYFGGDLQNTHGPMLTGRPVVNAQTGGDAVRHLAPGAMNANQLLPQAAPLGGTLRTYRLALLSDPTFASFWGGAANVLPAKALIVTRLTQIYEDEFSIHLVLAAGTDKLALNTVEEGIGANGPCGADPCFPSFSTMSGCAWTRNGYIMGLLAGADNFDVGHYIFGVSYGGVAGIGVVGKPTKYQGCTGTTNPTGDGLVVQTLAHEVGHEFGAGHTFDGTAGQCTADQRFPDEGVEPGSGSTIMAYGGICGNDNLQPRNDPFFSQKTRDYVTNYVNQSLGTVSETQAVALTGYDGTDSFRLRYDGNDSDPIVRGTNYSAAGIKAAIEAIPSWPAGGTVTISQLSGSPGAIDDTGFRITFGGSLAGSAVEEFQPVDMDGATGFTGVLTAGGPQTNQGTTSATGNAPPTVSAPDSVTIPYRTPFQLTASGSDPEGNPVTFLWEQNDGEGGPGTALRSPTKTGGPLFRIFGTTPTYAGYVGSDWPATGYNTLSTNPTRVFPDMDQILANNTDAEAPCPTTGSSTTIVDCFSEYLPMSDYAGPMHFRVTARDGNAGADGISSADTTVNLAPGTGPFLLTSPNTAVTVPGDSDQTITWDVAGTASAPISADNVKVSLSTDGGATYPFVLAASTPNDGSESLSIPNFGTTQARVKIEPVDGVFFDVSDANFTIEAVPLQDQTITFDPVPDKNYGDPSFEVDPTASSGLPVTLHASGACTRAGLTVSLNWAGTCTLTARQSGNLTWAAAPDVVQTITVGPRPTTTTFAMNPKHIKSGKKINITATVSAAGPTPAGSIRILIDDAVVASRKIADDGQIQVKVRITQPAGPHLVRVTFTPKSDNNAPSTSGSKPLTVK